MDNKKILIVGSGNSGSIIANEIANYKHSVCELKDIVDNSYLDLRQPETFLIHNYPKIDGDYIDPDFQVINYRKHNQTCLKNRIKRKKKKKGRKNKRKVK